MKKLLATALVLSLILSLAMPAMAMMLDEDGDPYYCEHKWSKWHTAQKGTCVQQGSRYRQCKRCGDTTDCFVYVKYNGQYGFVLWDYLAAEWHEGGQ